MGFAVTQGGASACFTASFHPKQRENMYGDRCWDSCMPRDDAVMTSVVTCQGCTDICTNQSPITCCVAYCRTHKTRELPHPKAEHLHDTILAW